MNETAPTLTVLEQTVVHRYLTFNEERRRLFYTAPDSKLFFEANRHLLQVSLAKDDEAALETDADRLAIAEADQIVQSLFIETKTANVFDVTTISCDTPLDVITLLGGGFESTIPYQGDGFQFGYPTSHDVTEWEHPVLLQTLSVISKELLADDTIHQKPEVFISVHDNSTGLTLDDWLAKYALDEVGDGFPMYVAPTNLCELSIASQSAISFQTTFPLDRQTTLLQHNDTIIEVGYIPVQFEGLAQVFAQVIASLTFE